MEQIWIYILIAIILYFIHKDTRTWMYDFTGMEMFAIFIALIIIYHVIRNIFYRKKTEKFELIALAQQNNNNAGPSPLSYIQFQPTTMSNQSAPTTLPANSNIEYKPISTDLIGNDSPKKEEKHIPIEVTRNDMKYNNYRPVDPTKLGIFANEEYVPKGYTSTPETDGWSILPPEKWYPVPPHPPVCVSESECTVCPVFTSGVPVNALDWKGADRVMQTDINIDYIKERLNS